MTEIWHYMPRADGSTLCGYPGVWRTFSQKTTTCAKCLLLLNSSEGKDNV